MSNLSGTTKAVIIGGAVLGVIAVILLVVVAVTGGFSNPLA